MDQPQQPQPASSPVPAPSFTPSEQNPIIIDHKHRPILGGAFLIIALALSILAGRLLFANYWPNTDEPMVVTTQTPTASVAGVPADWKTYTNTQYGFELKYPVNLELYEKKQSTFVSLIIDTPELIDQIKRIEEGPGGGAPLPTFLLTVSYDPDGKLRVESKCPTLEDGKSSTATQVTIGGVQALQCVDLARVAHNSERGPWLTTTFRNGPYHLWFSSGNYSDNEKQTYDQILSTFKFIEQTSLVPADWKAYVNPEYTIKYPPTWNFVENSDVSVGFYSASIGTPKDPRSYRVSLFRQPAETYPEFISNTTIGGLPAFTETLTREGSAIDNGGKFTQTYVTRANRDYYFLLNAGYESEIETYNRMLSTLTFTGILIKPGWTPHLSELYGFEIQYPNTFSRTSNSGENQVLALTGRTNTQGYFSVSVYRLPLRPTDGVPCSEGAMGGLQSHVINGTVTLSGATYPKCIISRSNDQALQVSFNKNGYTWLFQATAYDSQKNIIEQIFSTFKFTE